MDYTPLQQREIFHFLFLEQLLRLSDPLLYSVKGGVNLRFFFKSPRYSEDMDVDVFGGSVTTLEKNGNKILSDPRLGRTLKTYGIEEILLNDPAKAKHTETTQRFRLRLITSAGDELPTKVEFSRRGSAGNIRPVLDLVDPEMARRFHRTSFRAPHYAGEGAAVQKIEALAGRVQTQARDVFDLYLLFCAGFAQAATIEKICDVDLRKRAKLRLNTLTFEDFQGQVLEFLELDVVSEYAAPQAWKNMKEQISGLIGDV